MRFVGALVVAGAVAAVAAASVSQDFRFASKLPATGTPVGVAISNRGVVGAVNAALPGDLLVLSNGPTGLTVFDGGTAGPGSPRFDPIPSLTGATTLTTFRDATSGRDDVAVGGSNAIFIGVSDGSGGFTFRSIPIGGTPSDIMAGDFNGDGRDDLAWTDVASNDLVFALNNGSNFFLAPRAVSVGQSNATGQLVAGHAGSDADVDIFVATSMGVEIFEGVGDGTFGLPTNINLGKPSTSIAAADIDLDGLTDLVIGENNGFEVLHNQTATANGPDVFSGSFLSAGTGPVGAVITDVNGDHLLDVIALNRGSGNISTFLAKSAFDFTAANPSVPGFGPLSSVAVGRLNGDPFADIATVEDGSVDVFNGTGEGFPPAALPGLPFSLVPFFAGSTATRKRRPRRSHSPSARKPSTPRAREATSGTSTFRLRRRRSPAASST